MKEIQLTRGLFAKVDDEDYEWLMQWKWHVDGGGYACRAERIGLRKHNKLIRFNMHKVIMNAPKRMVVDHINGDRLDNRRENLRICNISENNCNVNKRKDNTTGFKGILWKKDKWEAWISKDGVKIYLGRFADKMMAAKAYDKAARKYHGEFAKTNF